MAKVSVDDFVSALKEWTVVDVMNAIKAIETEFGVTAAAPVAVAAAPAGGGAGAAAPEAEQTEFQVVLTSPGDAKIGVIKVVREITGLGLKEAKDLVDQAPKPVKQGINREEAEGVLKKLKDAGAGAEIKEERWFETRPMNPSPARGGGQGGGQR
jgi:large subunit ribosomal protein L7/L12